MLKALDLCCCAGGSTRGLQLAGFHVTGVDIDPQPSYCGDCFIQDDVLNRVSPVFLRQFDFIWASPPCQRYSAATRQSGTPSDWPDLIEPIRSALRHSQKPWIIENVVGAPLLKPGMLCGAMFGLGVIRHRLFESNLALTFPAHTKHKGSLVTGEYVTVAGNGGVPSWTMKERVKRGLPRIYPEEMSLATWRRAMGIDWMKRHELVEAIPPAYAEYLGKQVTL